MNAALDTLPSWVAAPVAFLLILGGLIVAIGALGLLRLPDFYQRIHGPAITITLGAGCILIASMLFFSGLQSRPVIHELLITIFVLLSAPVVSMLVMRAAVYRDLRAGKLKYVGQRIEEVAEKAGEVR
jgi:multicomponent K+:H+ antiporter subunit G